MSQPGWFHRFGTGPGPVRWTPAAAPGPSSASVPHQHTPATASPPAGRFPIGQVNGNHPSDLTAFVGVATFTVIHGYLTYRVFGTGNAHGQHVTFHQHDLGRDGRFLRTWTITATPDGIVAETANMHSVTADGD